MGKKWGKLPGGVEVRSYPTRDALRINFTYKGIPCRETLSVPVSKANIKYAANLRGEILNKIDRGTFRYGDYFPNSPKLKLFSSKGPSTTVGEYMVAYLANADRRGLSKSTLTGYGKCQAAFKKLHDIPVGELTSNDLLHYIEQATVAEKTLRNRMSFLKSSIARAVVEGTIVKNPAEGINLSLYINRTEKVSTRGDHTDVDAFSPKEIEAILHKCKSDELPIVQFCLHTGLRSSEWTGLQWQDVDLIHKTVHIVEVRVEGQLKKPKTKAGRRVIELDETAYQALVTQKERTLLNGTYVFLNGSGTPWTHENFRKHKWTRILKAAGVRYRYPYQLRHTFASRHISNGMNIWKLSKQMGHASPEMLFKHYGSYIEEYAKSETNDLSPRFSTDLVREKTHR